MSDKYKKAGFTLIEILIASAIIVTILSMIYGSYFAASKSIQSYQAKITLSRKLQNILNQMSQQLRCSYAPESTETTNNSSESSALTSNLKKQNLQISQKTKSQDSSTSNYFYTEPGALNPEVLCFVTANSGKKQPEGLFEITYKFDKASDTIFLSQKRFTDTSINTIKKKNYQLFLEHVNNFEITFFDGQQWLRKWDFSKQKNLPRAVKINISCEDEYYRQYQLSTITNLYCWKSKNSKPSPDKLAMAEIK